MRYVSRIACACLSASVVLAGYSMSWGADAAQPMDSSAAVRSDSIVGKMENPNLAVTMPAGIDAKDLHESAGVQAAFKAVADSSLGKDPLNNVISRLVDQDRQRLAPQSDDKAMAANDQLPTIVKQLGDAWHNKYQGNFDIDASKTFPETALKIGTGEVSNPDALVGQWPLAATDAGVRAPTGAMSNGDLKDAHKTFGGEVNLEKGRNVAVASLAGPHGLPPLTASLIHEAPSTWKFDVPNDLTRQQLHDNLVANLTHVYNMQGQWPADYHEAERHVTYAVVAALYNVNLDRLGNNMPNAAAPGNTNMNRTAGER